MVVGGGGDHDVGTGDDGDAHLCGSTYRQVLNGGVKEEMYEWPDHLLT